MRLNLAGKALLLLSVPLVFQIGLFAALLTIQNRAAGELAALAHPIEVTAEFSRAMIAVIQVGSACDSKDPFILLTPELIETRDRGIRSLKRLLVILADGTASRALAEDLLQQGLHLNHLIDAETDAAMVGPGQVDQTQVLKVVKPEYEKFFSRLPKIDNLLDQETKTARQHTISMLGYTQNFDSLLYYGILAELVLIILSLIWFRSDIARRFATIIENSFKLASNRPLSAQVGGNDEIAAIDQTFHDMAKQLADARNAEAIILENARAAMCAVSEKLALMNASPACKEIFGYDPDELLQMRVARLLGAEDDAVLLFDAVRAGHSQSFELRCRRKNGTEIDTEWSVDWSPDRQQFFCTIYDASERKNAERMRDELVHLISSGLQKPLATISSIIPKIETAIPEDQHYLLPALSFANSQMTLLVRDLIDMEQIELGTLRFNRTLTSLAEIVDQAIQLVSGHALRHGIKVEGQAIDAVIYADKDRLSQVLVNLLTNAIKFSPRNSVVRVEAQDRGDAVQLSVIDHGRGIPAAALPKIFDRFRQTEVADARAKGGSGLGLAICQALIQKHDSSISISSSEAGTTFSFDIAKQPKPGGTGGSGGTGS
ncbi:MAG TPA: ATP-binding protein [Trichormus sp.]